MRIFAVTASAALLALLALLAWWLLEPATPLGAQFPRSRAVYAADGELLRLTTANDERYRLWVELKEFSPTLIEAVLMKEDRWFAWHLGVNPWRLTAAIAATLQGGQRQGASTISMQLVRMLHRLNTRNVSGKLQQIGHALLLEARYSKPQILEAYLNLAPYGLNVEGAATASLVYFNKRALDLTLTEALTLAVLPQRPRLKRNGAALTLPEDLRAARTRLLADWLAAYPELGSQRASLQIIPPMRAPLGLPFSAPHLTDQLLREARDRAEATGAITSTIDVRLQQLLESKVRGYLHARRALGIDNAAVMLVDTRDMAVKGLVGSADFFNPAINGQVNAAHAKRSPGSTLKPFIYALGIDQGLLHPLTVLRDVPSAFGPFAPENFDGRFLGPITATDALIRSRNIPAVSIAAKLSNPSLYAFLHAAHITRLQSESHYGLALVLGGGEVSMSELAVMYAGLSHDGLFRALRWRQDEKLVDGVQLLSAEASFIVREMLEQNPRPDGARSSHKSAWKTGTSWAFRDAWSVGIIGPYVLVVWLGHFDGRAQPGLTGVHAAAPLYFSIIDALAATGTSLKDPPRRWPLNLTQIQVCSLSGDLPNAHCPDLKRTWFIPGKSPIRVSTLHRPVLIDQRNGAAVCRPSAHTRVQIFEYWPSELAHSFELAGMKRRTPPRNAGCATSQLASAPLITAPRRGVTYQLNAQSGHLSLNADADASVRRLYWFANGAWLGASRTGLSLDWAPRQSGLYTLSVLDDQGGSASREVRVAIK